MWVLDISLFTFTLTTVELLSTYIHITKYMCTVISQIYGNYRFIKVLIYKLVRFIP